MSNVQTQAENTNKNKPRFSIVFKLGGHFFFKLLGVFLIIDFILCLSYITLVINQADQTSTEVIEIITESGLPLESENNWLDIYGAKVSLSSTKPDGWQIPSIFFTIFANESRSEPHYLYLPQSQESESVLLRLNSLEYNSVFHINDEAAILSLRLASPIHQFKIILICLLVIELLILLQWLSSSFRTIRKTLSPIAELTQATQSLNAAHMGALTPKEMERLAGKLDGINADKLDTRIALDSTQDELKNLAEAINAMLDRINESYRAQVRFVSDASHELRTPISVIQGYANLLDRWGKDDPKTLQESIAAIKDEAANMKLIIEQLLFLARGDSNTMTLQMESFDISELAGEVYRETQLIDSGHQFTFQSHPVFIYADEALIKQAIRILLDNAIKYTPSGGSIKISTMSKEGNANLSIQDDGIGIPSDAIPKIFDRFYRADESRARATGGTGLGLSIADWIIERHGGYMEVLSRENIGTRFTIVLPEKAVNISTTSHEDTLSKE